MGTVEPTAFTAAKADVMAGVPVEVDAGVEITDATGRAAARVNLTMAVRPKRCRPHLEREIAEASARENMRRLMYKLEALRHKADGREVTVTNGFHSTDHHARIRGSTTGPHPLGHAADVAVAGMSTYAIYRVAQTCGFSGLGFYTQSWLHCDSRVEHDQAAAWSWGSGTI